MSRSTLAAIPARRTAALLATATTTFGLLTLASPAHADSVVQLSGPAGPVPANTAYTVTLDVPNTGSDSRSTNVNVKLSGAAATVTSATASSPMWDCDFSAGSAGFCWNLANLPDPASITLTVLPTAGGTVTTDVDARDFANRPVGSATLDTQITAPAPTVPYRRYWAGPPPVQLWLADRWWRAAAASRPTSARWASAWSWAERRLRKGRAAARAAETAISISRGMVDPRSSPDDRLRPDLLSAPNRPSSPLS
ncbi:hypothetical protein TR51_20225 [Kitasatospora griseola]|uniref:DUF11 domain-containing protein n=1 Tax=Kitasatospora griseola TaxID=2064 RepID=A0A0D0PME2_KITGR|nr:hypothetical protein [Kitasatospora griseola]KIQ61642.1 hypothetical protein TR51_20225 [Kitasatospora griseola]